MIEHNSVIYQQSNIPKYKKKKHNKLIKPLSNAEQTIFDIFFVTLNLSIYCFLMSVY